MSNEFSEIETIPELQVKETRNDKKVKFLKEMVARVEESLRVAKNQSKLTEYNRFNDERQSLVHILSAVEAILKQDPLSDASKFLLSCLRI